MATVSCDIVVYGQLGDIKGKVARFRVRETWSHPLSSPHVT